MINETFSLKRDASAERAAVDGIVSLFTDKWDETSKKSSREITALVLMQMKDACIVAPKGSEETEESIKLKHSCQFFEKTIEQLQSGEPLKMVISGSALDEIIDNLRNINNAARGEEYETDIRDRIDFFVSKLNKRLEQLQVADNSRKQKIIIYSVLAGAALALFVQFVGVTSDYFDMGTFILILACSIGICFGLFAKIIK